MEIARQVGKRIKVLREGRGLTQAQVARMLGKSVETISNFERGKVVTSLLTLEHLAGLLEVRVRDFFDDTALPTLPKMGSDHATKVRVAADVLPPEDLEIVAGLVDVLEFRRRRKRA